MTDGEKQIYNAAFGAAFAVDYHAREDTEHAREFAENAGLSAVYAWAAVEQEKARRAADDARREEERDAMCVGAIFVASFVALGPRVREDAPRVAPKGAVMGGVGSGRAPAAKPRIVARIAWTGPRRIHGMVRVYVDGAHAGSLTMSPAATDAFAELLDAGVLRSRVDASYPGGYELDVIDERAQAAARAR